MEATEVQTSGTGMDPYQLASLLRIQNMIKLCKQLKLPVAYKVSRVSTTKQQQLQQQQQLGASPVPTPMKDGTSGPSQQQQQQQDQSSMELAVVVHVLSDHAFKKYLQNCSASDLMLLRGLLLKVQVDSSYQHILGAKVQQAFLPKFENEGQDSSIADDIVQQADQRPMVITIKHSGSLVTLSHEGFAAKNSLDNEFTAGAALLLQTHFQRLLGSDEGLAHLKKFMTALQDRQLAVSFEMVTGCHGHHGQLPAGEYLVTTSAHTSTHCGQPTFLPWTDFRTFCLEWKLPLNDTWIIHGSAAAAAARELLDHLALSGCTTAQALGQLNNMLLQQRPQNSGQGLGGSSSNPIVTRVKSGAVYLPGTYPHDDWQGTRIEGFVVSQGQGSGGSDGWRGLEEIRVYMANQVVRFQDADLRLQKPYQQLLQQSGGNIAAAKASVRSSCAAWLPDTDYELLDARRGASNRHPVIDLLEQFPVPVDAAGAFILPDGNKIFSRAALEGLGSEELAQIMTQAGKRSSIAADLTSIQAMQILAGPGHQQSGLRYKKKMLMWSDTEVGYCMMTFGIRNGLTALRLGEGSYLSSLAAMAKHSWGLPGTLVEKVVYFGRCWARWIARHGGVGSVKEDNYLTQAEAFVSDFLAGSATVGGEQRPEGSFHGIIMALDASERLVKQVQKALHLQHLLQPNSGDLVFSNSLVREGTLLWLPSDQGLPKNNKQVTDFIKAAAPYAYLLIQPPRASGTTPAAKKATGMHTSKVRALLGMLTAPGLLPADQLEQRTFHLPRAFAAPPAAAQTAAAAGAGEKGNGQQRKGKGQKPAAAGAAATSEATTAAGDGQPPNNNVNNDDDGDGYDEPTEEHMCDVVRAVQEGFGVGSPAGTQDPAFITCFVALPGVGKSVLVNQLSQLAATTNGSSSSGGNSAEDGGSSSSSNTSVQVLNSDTLKAKQGISGMKYWHQVSGAAESFRGGGHRALVLADKNLVPNPRDNVTRVVDILNRSGATTIAVIPTCISSSSSSTKATPLQQQQQLTPELPFPLELIALCMLRVLQRHSHEGGLDAALPHAMSVVITFASYFRDLSEGRLQQQLMGCFQHVVSLPIASTREDKQVPTAVLDHIAEGLSNVSPSSSPPLPPEWETRMVELLSNPANQAAINAIALPLDDCAKRLQTLISQIMDSSSSSSRGDSSSKVAALQDSSVPSAAEGGGELVVTNPRTGVSGSLEDLNLGQQQQQQQLLTPVDLSAAAAAAAAAAAGGEGGPDGAAAAAGARYIGVAVLHEDQLKQQLQEALGPELQLQDPAQQQVWPSTMKSKLHVTLWHNSSTADDSSAVRDKLMAAVGQEVQVQIVAVDCSPEVTAAKVELLAGPEVVMEVWPTLGYPHITLAVREGARAVDSNQLPARVLDAADVAFRVEISEPLLVVGQVLPFE